MTFTLSNGIKMPAVGIGTFMMTPQQAEAAVYEALSCGYRMIDTAQAYMNERAVGRGMRNQVFHGRKYSSQQNSGPVSI